jgi:hypothetical protein
MSLIYRSMDPRYKLSLQGGGKPIREGSEVAEEKFHPTSRYLIVRDEACGIRSRSENALTVSNRHRKDTGGLGNGGKE